MDQNQFTYIMSEITRLRIENAELKKNMLVRQNLMRSEPLHYRSRSIMSESDQMPDIKSEVMFSDDKGFEQFGSPNYWTRAEKFGFMSTAGETSEGEKHKEVQRKLHKFSNYPIGIGNKYF